MKIPEDKAQAHQTRQEKETIRRSAIYNYVGNETKSIKTHILIRNLEKKNLSKKRLTRIKQR